MARILGDADFCKNAANAYLQTAIYCNEVGKSTTNQTFQCSSQSFFSIPAIMNVAFACELFLIAICLRTKSDGALRGHDLFMLHKDLKMTQKTELEKVFRSHCLFESVTLESTLKNHCNVFKEWRYIYENEKVSNPSAYEVYIDNLLAAAVSLKEYVDTIKTP